jgi:hypothetical protein
LPVSSWNPGSEPLAVFVARRLVEDAGVDPQMAGRLVTEPGLRGYHVMPVLDGLDEIPAELRARALLELDGFAAADHPLVVTCRRREFEQAVAVAEVLSRAAVIGLEPVRPKAALVYLRGAKAGSRWDTVAAELERQPHGSLARLLSTPLMVSLARDTYARPGSDPGELVGLAAQGRGAGHLAAGYLAAVYRAPGGSGPSGGLRVYDPSDAARWLSTLAFLMYENGSRDLYWWRLPLGLLSARPQRARLLWRGGFVAMTAALTGAVLLLWCGWLVSVAAVGLVGILCGLIMAGVFDPVWPQPYGDASRSRAASRIWRLGLFGLLCGLLAGTVLGAMVAGLAAGLGGTSFLAFPPKRSSL